jgi:murein DD-endopeptidase MepM/ murein hydrolase activator NlpD
MKLCLSTLIKTWWNKTPTVNGNSVIKPLKDWDTLPTGYEFGQKTTYSEHHLGIDKTAKMWTEVLAPTDGKIVQVVTGQQGGLTIHFRDKWNKLWRFMHLVKSTGQGPVKEGSVIAWSGNSGTTTTGPHLHCDISRGELQIYDWTTFYDPILYIKERMSMDLKPNSIYYSKLDKEYYWIKSDKTVLFIPHDRLALATAMQVGTTVEESLKNQVIGNF